MSKVRSLVFVLPVMGLVLYPLLGWASRQSEWVYALWALVLLASWTSGLIGPAGACWFRGLGKKALLIPVVLGVLLVLSFLSRYLWGSLAEWSLLIVYVLAFLAVWYAAEHRVRPVLLIYGIIAAGVITSVYGLYRFFLERSFDSWIVAQFGWHNTLGGFLALVLPLAVAGFLFSRERQQTLVQGLASYLIATVLVLSYSRGAYLSVLPGLVLLCLVRLRRPGTRQAFKYLAILVFCVLLSVKVLTRAPMLQILPSTVSQRSGTTSELGESSTQGRLAFWQGAVGIFRANPWTGAGLGNFARLYPQYQSDVRYFAYDPHNLYLGFAAEAGILGILALGGLVLAIGLRGAAIVRSAWNEAGTSVPALDTYWRVGVFAGVMAGLLHNAVDLDFDTPAVAVLLIGLIALVFARSVPPVIKKRAKPVPTRTLLLSGGLLLVGVLGTGIVIAMSTLVDLRSQASVKAWQAGELDRAEQLLTDASWAGQLDSDYFQSLTWLSNARGDTAAALDAADQAVKLDPFSDRVYYNRGYLEASQKNYALAEQDYEYALSLDSCNRPRYYYDLATIYLSLGSTDRAIALLYDLREKYSYEVMSSDMPSRTVVQPDIVRSYRLLSTLLTDTGDTAEAKAVTGEANQIEALSLDQEN